VSEQVKPSFPRHDPGDGLYGSDVKPQNLVILVKKNVNTDLKLPEITDLNLPLNLYIKRGLSLTMIAGNKLSERENPHVQGAEDDESENFASRRVSAV
jgi:hypothetical protein